jgi:hypothetical protein
MKGWICLACAAALGAFAVWLGMDSDSTQTRPEAVPAATQTDERQRVTREEAEVFRRAFWRHATEHEQIHHAERREWIDEDAESVHRWQWFIALTPGAELLEALSSGAIFELHRPADPRPWATLAPPPEWFPLAASVRHVVQQAPSGGLTLLYDPQSNRLHATDEGHGFAAPIASVR